MHKKKRKRTESERIKRRGEGGGGKGKLDIIFVAAPKWCTYGNKIRERERASER